MTSSNQDPNIQKASPEDYIRQHPSLGIPNVQAIGLSGKFETTEERDSRLKREEEAHTAQQKLIFWKFIVKEASVYVLAMIIFLGMGWISISKLQSSSASQADIDWAKTTLAAMGSAVAGYLFGKSSST